MNVEPLLKINHLDRGKNSERGKEFPGLVRSNSIIQLSRCESWCPPQKPAYSMQGPLRLTIYKRTVERAKSKSTHTLRTQAAQTLNQQLSSEYYHFGGTHSLCIVVRTCAATLTFCIFCYACIAQKPVLCHQLMSRCSSIKCHDCHSI